MGGVGDILEEEFIKLREHLSVKLVKPCILLSFTIIGVALKMSV
jgi:hypothetical protein